MSTKAGFLGRIATSTRIGRPFRSLLNGIHKRRFSRVAIGRFSGFLLARVAASAMQAFTLILLARGIGPAAFGAFSTSIALGVILGSLLGLGSSAQSMRLLATSAPDRIATTLILLRFGTAIIVSTIIFLVGHWGPQDIIILAIIYTASELFAELCTSIMLGMQRAVLAHGAILVRRTLPMLALLLGMHFGLPPTRSLSVGWSASGILLLMMCVPFVARPMPILVVVRDGIHFWSSTAMAKLQKLDVVLLQTVVGSSFVGQYSAAARITGPLSLLVATTLSVITPKLATAKDRTHLASIFNEAHLALCVYMGLLVTAAPVAFWLGPLLLGPDYQESAPLFAAFTIASGIDAAAQSYIALLYAVDKARILMAIRLVSLPIGLAILIIASVLAGVIGAAGGVVAIPLIFLVMLHCAVARAGILMDRPDRR